MMSRSTMHLLKTTLKLVTIASLSTVLATHVAVADTLIVEVNNIKKAGEMHVAVYDNAEAFEADRGEKAAQHRVSWMALL